MQTATYTLRPAFRPEFVPATDRQEKRSLQARRLLVAQVQTEETQLPHGVIKIDQAARTKATIALIEAEYKKRSSFYLLTLRRAGVAPHELDDALGEVFALAVRWASSYDSSKSDISSWLGNQVVRTVASSIYGARRPAWRLQQEQEHSSDLAMQPECAYEPPLDVEAANDPAEQFVVDAFMSALEDELSETEISVIEICNMDLLHGRLTAEQLTQMRELLRVSSLTTVRAFARKLGNKMRVIATQHFGMEALTGRPGFDKLTA
nr:hypothetical protein [uncultured Pseudogulbenkiania sp.]